MALTTNLVAYWKLDESSGNASDASGNGNTLTNNNTVSFNSAIINNGADFTSSNTNKSLRISTNLGIDGGNITMGGWFYFYDQTGLIAMQTQSSTSKIEYSLKIEGGGVKGNRNRIGSAEDQTTAYTLSNNTWYHCMMTYDGTTVVLYVNGVARYRVASSGNGSTTTSNATTIGCDVNSGSGADQLFANMKADEVGVWSRALSSLEIAELYNNGSALAYPLTEPSVTLNLGVGSYFKLDESSGNASDSVGSNTLTNTGSATYSSGKINNGVNFTATTMYLGNGSPANLPTGQQEFTMACWVNFTNFSTARYFFSIGGTANNARACIRCDSSTAWFIDDNGVGTGFPAVSAMSTGTWYHIVYTYPGSGNVYTAYLNGTSIGTANNTRPPNLGTSNLSIGSGNNASNSANLVGSMDEVGVWNRVLTTGEITSLYNSGTGLQYPFGAVSSTATFSPILMMGI